MEPFDPADPIGIHADISDDLYGEAAGVRRSELKCLVGGQPADVLHYQQHGIADSTALLLGRVTDLAILTPELLEERVAVFDGAARRGKAWDEFRKANHDKDIVTEKEYESVLAMTQAVEASPVASGLLAGTKRQLSAFWDHTTLSGRQLRCKTRPDAVIEEHGRTVDVKTCESFADGKFFRSVIDFAYDVQGYMNCEGFRENGFDWREHVIVAIRKPTARNRVDVRCFVWMIDSPWIERGQHNFHALAHRYEKMHRENETHGWSDIVTELPMPKWVAGEMAELEMTNSELRTQ